MTPLNIVLNVLWILLGGGWAIFVQYLVAGLLLCCTVIGIPWGVQSFKLAFLGLLPFGQEAVPTGELAQGGLGLVCNIIWLILGGVWIFVSHLILMVVCAVTIIGIPFAVQHWKLARLALTPFGHDIRAIKG